MCYSQLLGLCGLKGYIYTRLGNQCFIVRKTRFSCAAAKGIEIHSLDSTYSDFKIGHDKNCSYIAELELFNSITNFESNLYIGH